jgi:hypothetical protein
VEAAAAPTLTLRAGMLVDVKGTSADAGSQLCVVDRPDGKRNWFCLNKFGKCVPAASLHPSAVRSERFHRAASDPTPNAPPTTRKRTPKEPNSVELKGPEAVEQAHAPASLHLPTQLTRPLSPLRSMSVTPKQVLLALPGDEFTKVCCAVCPPHGRSPP